jgi:hypothetical protein
MTAPLTLAAHDLPVRLGRPEGADWVPAGRLLEPGSPLLEERLRDFGERMAAPRVAVAASLLLEAYAGLLASVGFGCLLGAGMVAELGADNVSLRFGPGGTPDLVALQSAPRAVPDLVARQRAGAVRERLAAREVREGLATGEPRMAAFARLAEGLLDRHLGVLVARLGELRVRRGPRALWGLVANGCANALVEAAMSAGHPPEMVHALVGVLFGLPGSPLPGPPRLLEVPTGGGGTKLLRKRVSCCLFWTRPGCDPCATCPILSDEQAAARAAARIRAPAASGS